MSPANDILAGLITIAAVRTTLSAFPKKRKKRKIVKKKKKTKKRRKR